MAKPKLKRRRPTTAPDSLTPATTPAVAAADRLDPYIYLRPDVPTEVLRASPDDVLAWALENAPQYVRHPRPPRPVEPMVVVTQDGPVIFHPQDWPPEAVDAWAAQHAPDVTASRADWRRGSHPRHQAHH